MDVSVTFYELILNVRTRLWTAGTTLYNVTQTA